MDVLKPFSEIFSLRFAMATSKRRYHPINVDEVLRLQRAMGWTVETLARKAGLDWKTVNKWLKGEVEGALISKVSKLATALGVSPDRIIAAPGRSPNATAEHPESHYFDMNIKVRGSVTEPSHFMALLNSVGRFAEILRDHGITVDSHEGQAALVTSSGGDAKRIIVGIWHDYGMCNQTLMIASIRPSKYEDFKLACKEGKIDTHKIDTYGEILEMYKAEWPQEGRELRVQELFEVPAEAARKWR